MLEDRIEPPISSSFHEKLDFKLIFSSGYTSTTDALWHEGQVEVIETSHDPVLPQSPVATSPYSRSVTRPSVTFALASGDDTPQSSAKDVKDICVTITQAMQENRSLKWYLVTPQRLRYCHVSHKGRLHSSQHCSRTASLAHLLKASETLMDISRRSRMVPLPTRGSLALTLTSTFIQLVMTPWVENFWSKDSIQFPVKTPAREGSDGQDADLRKTDPSQVDLSHPLVIKTFSNSTPTLPMSIGQSEPRRMVLELGIMLLELFHERTFEDYLSTSGYDFHNKHTYEYRRFVAQQWLNESNGVILAVWHEVTTRCVQCSFDNVPAKPQWDEGLLKGLVQGVIEPLQKCR